VPQRASSMIRSPTGPKSLDDSQSCVHGTDDTFKVRVETMRQAKCKCSHATGQWAPADRILAHAGTMSTSRDLVLGQTTMHWLCGMSLLMLWHWNRVGIGPTAHAGCQLRTMYWGSRAATSASGAPLYFPKWNAAWPSSQVNHRSGSR
jgi:hypothetical protein